MEAYGYIFMLESRMASQLQALEGADLIALQSKIQSSQVAALTEEQVQALGTAQVAAFTTTQAAELEGADLAKLGTAQLRALAADVVAGLTPPVAPRVTRLAQGPLDEDTGTVADPLAADRSRGEGADGA